MKRPATRRRKKAVASWRAQAEIEQETNKAREALRAKVAELAVMGAEKILRKEINADAHKDIVESWPTRSGNSNGWRRATIARPYADAIYARAVETDKLDLWSDMLELLAAAAQDPALAGLIASPKLDMAQMTDLMLDIGGGRLSDGGQNLVRLLRPTVDCLCCRKSPRCTRPRRPSTKAPSTSRSRRRSR